MRTNQKETLVFLPGWSFHASVWEGVALNFSQYDVRLLDLPEMTASQDIAEIAATLARHIPPQAIIVAWSLSGLAAIYFSHVYPQYCRKLIIVSGLPKFFSGGDWEAISLENAREFQDKALQDMSALQNEFLHLVRFPSRDKRAADFLKSHLRGMTCVRSLRLYLSWMLTVDYRSLLAEMSVPVTFLFGERDAVVPLPRELQSLNKNITIKTIPNAGHAAFVTHKAEFLQQLQEALADG
jgi:pimeloyl-[acyl-carrier protein] methyl ester esterase